MSNDIHVKGRFEGLSNEAIIARAFVDVVEEKEALAAYQKDPELAGNGFVGALAKITEGLEENFEEIVRSRYPSGDAIQ